MSSIEPNHEDWQESNHYFANTADHPQKKKAKKQFGRGVPEGGPDKTSSKIIVKRRKSNIASSDNTGEL